MVPGRLFGVLLQMVIQLRVQGALGQRLLQLIEQTVLLTASSDLALLSSSSSSSALIPVPGAILPLLC